MISANDDWNSDWLKTQQHFWQSWANIAGKSGANVPTMGTNPFSPDWSQSLDQWWRLVSPQASDPVSEMFQRVVDTGKNFNKMAEQGFSLGQKQSQDDLIQGWLENIQSGFESWIKQISSNKSTLFSNNDSLVPEWMGLNKGALEIWDSLANSIGLGGVPEIPGLDKSKVELSRLLKSPALGQWREHQQQLQTVAQLMIEFQEADQIYKLAFAQMGIRSIEALRQRLIDDTKNGIKVSTVREFYDLWVEVNEEVYGEFAMTDEYQVIHGDFVNSLMALRKETNTLNEKLYKAVNLPTRSEINTINKRLQEQRRENIKLSSEIEKLSKQIASETNKKDATTSTAHSTIKDHKDLSIIKGVGPKLVEKLQTHGINTLEQIAKMKTAELEVLDKKIDGKGRVLRDQWAAQANQLINQ